LILSKKKDQGTNERQCKLTAAKKGWTFGAKPDFQVTYDCYKTRSNGITSIHEKNPRRTL
jgi:hypothetical protein